MCIPKTLPKNKIQKVRQRVRMNIEWQTKLKPVGHIARYVCHVTVWLTRDSQPVKVTSTLLERTSNNFTSNFTSDCVYSILYLLLY
jgi:hypothetical protein